MKEGGGRLRVKERGWKRREEGRMRGRGGREDERKKRKGGGKEAEGMINTAGKQASRVALASISKSRPC